MEQSPAGLVVTVAMHAAILGALLAYEPARSALAAAAPMMVDWIAAPKVEPATAPPEPPKPKVVHHRPKPVEAPKVIAAPMESPSSSPALVPAPPPPPPQQVAAIPAPAPEPVLIEPDYKAAYLKNQLAYPHLSQKLREQGQVMLRVHVNPKGGVDDIALLSSSGFPRLDESARQQVSQWKFVPARRGSEPVAAWVRVPINFKL